jgi:hypothetical protein
MAVASRGDRGHAAPVLYHQDGIAADAPTDVRRGRRRAEPSAVDAFDPTPTRPEVPEKDNGVHSDAIQLPAAIDQVIELLE